MNVSIFAPVYNPHSKPQYDLTLPQLALLFVWFLSVFIWLLRYARVRITNGRVQCCLVDSASGGDNAGYQTPSKSSLKIIVTDTASAAAASGGATVPADCNFVARTGTEHWRRTDAVCDRKYANGRVMLPEPETEINVSRFNGHVKSNEKHREAFSSAHPAPPIDDCLRHISLLAGLMTYFYLCDYIKAGLF